MSKRASFSNSGFILCEGEEDAAFTRAVMKGRNLSRKLDVSPNIDIGNVGGDSGFLNALSAIEPITGFNMVKDVGIVLDNDDTPSASLTKIAELIKKLKANGTLARNWGVPTEVGVKAPGDPSVSVWTWPSKDKKGCLETLLLEYIRTKYPTEFDCIKGMTNCVGIQSWPISKLHKSQVRMFTSVKCRGNPAVPLSLLWRNFKAIIPVTDSQFRDFTLFVQSV